MRHLVINSNIGVMSFRKVLDGPVIFPFDAFFLISS
jgi:hypothetical protein